MYRCEAGSVEGFVRQLAVAYVGHGYWFYVTGTIPPHKSPDKIDQKIITRYGIDISRWTRLRQKKRGLAKVQYLRFRRFFVIIATHGEHHFFAEEAKSINDIRETPLTFHGYSIGYRRGWADAKWHPSVRIAAERYRRLRRRFEAIAVHRSVEQLRVEFQRLPFEPWAPVRHQLWSLVRLVNCRRKLANLELLLFPDLKFKPRKIRPFDQPGGGGGDV